ncbi:hypothetical protein FNO01nite_27220 [Flavobacterium noncentrifugens]|uniref:Por secretion system C-terminal sorting domain-containing protein n=1 Tax=Flavobacterium noncentrifugens TaxID=1128970 RepID=A0A1G9CIP9_9FLAO|nr:T9SS type A sorting domain-containing protein [Flavobacterium noncentrifugens]GEP52050.1 hypothetical protein FNO01nite_27220 [Flavobacterium noncentrifugens]SDK51522.1 Por secretion system C-terminal sorting domain-containing protein [Flavobacterium noncentrifugens]
MKTILQYQPKTESIMTKKLLFILLLFTGMANAQIVTIPDPTFKARLLASSATDPANNIAKNFSDQWIAIDANNDGNIQLSEAQAVKYLNITGQTIVDLTGLNSFSNLQILFNLSNGVSTLDLTALTHLTSFSSYNMYYLTSLNLSNLPNLTTVNCIGMPILTSVNLSNSTNINKLILLYCALTSLNVNGLVNLTALSCSGNQLTNLNGLPVSLTALDCSNNLLTSLNFNGLPNLTDLNCSENLLTSLSGLATISKLNCQNNKLTALNVNEMSNISELSCGGNELTTLNVNALTSLTKLDCSANKLTILSISGLPNLVSLNCSINNDLTTVTLANLPALEDFQVLGNINNSGDTISSLTSLSLSGLPNLQKLNCSNGKLTSLNLSGLSSLTELDCSSNLITTLALTNLPNLKILNCYRNYITNLNASNLTNLTELYCAGGYIVDGQIIGHLANLNVAGLSNLKKLHCPINLLTTINLTGLVSLEELFCDGTQDVRGYITSLNVNGLSNLKRLGCSFQGLTSLDVSNLSNLIMINCSFNNISSLDLTGLINLESLEYSYNQLSSLNLVNLPKLTDLYCSYNHLVTLNVLGLTSLKTLFCTNNSLTNLNLSGLSNLVTLDFSNNQLTLTNVSGLSTNLKTLVCVSNNLTSLDVSGLTNLEVLNCYTNELTSLDVSSLTNLKQLDLGRNHITNINVSSCPNLEMLAASDNELTEINITGLNNLNTLSCGGNQITSLDLSNHENLSFLDYSYDVMPNLDVSSLVNLTYLGCINTQSTVLDVSSLTKLEVLHCDNNQLTTLDTSNSPNLNQLYCTNNQLASLFIKNGRSEEVLNFFSNPGLQYICVDDAQIQAVQTQLNTLGMNATVSNSYCSFTPGGNYNTIKGIAIFDANNDGCDITDVVNPFVKLRISDGTETGATVTNINGTYGFYTNAGNYTIAPNTENPTWFSFSPNAANFVFTNYNNISTQNFCIAAVGLHKDIEVVFAQLESARPGFNAPYKIVFKNKGNQMQSGTVTLAFDDSRTDFVGATPTADIAVPNSLSWNFTNLMPFENRSIDLTLNINGPMEIPAVNNGDILNFTTSITPVVGDDFPSDNQFNYNQTVVGSFDPNDIICLEGETVAPVEIGNYLHYMVNFENTGTAAAENIVVRLEVNPEEFDINSLQVMNASHPAFAEVRNNTVEFKFANINLLPTAGDPPVSGHGNILFKMKSKATLETGNLVKNRANIFFDYNFPIVTNDAETTFTALSTDVFTNDQSVVVFPNPAQDIININCNNTIKSIELYDIQGRILEVFAANKISAQINISDKSKGVYFVKIITEKGKKVTKIIKE